MDTRFVNVVVKGDSMWPTLSAGSTVRFERVEAEALEAGQVVLLDHPFRPDLRIIKRIQSIDKTQIFVVGDNPDPTASEDSHDFGKVRASLVLAVLSN